MRPPTVGIIATFKCIFPLHPPCGKPGSLNTLQDLTGGGNFIAYTCGRMTVRQNYAGCRLTASFGGVMNIADVLAALRDIHDAIRDAVVESCEQASAAAMSSIAADDAGDTIYAIDKVSEERLIELVSERTATTLALF